MARRQAKRRADRPRLATGPSPAARARAAVNLSLEEAAKRARVCPAYLSRIERHGDAPYALAHRLSTLYGCPMVYFLYASLGGRTLK
jgi:hypothetical protein